MSATNSTANYELPIFLATDKPAWLTDWNGAMSAIDTAIHAAQATADGAQTTASAATADISTINASLTTITGNITSLTTSVNSNTGAINTINSLIGNGEPTTSDKTLIGAINEIYGMITGGGGDEIEAQNVSYDNTTSGLTADDVQSAIDEVYAAIPVGPTPGQYDFDLSAYSGDATVTSSNATVNSANTKVSYLLNADKSIGKIYGGVSVTSITGLSSSDFTKVATISASDFAPITNAYDIYVGFGNIITSGSSWSICRCKLHFNTNGSIDVMISAGVTSLEAFNVSLPPCVLFLKDMGD